MHGCMPNSTVEQIPNTVIQSIRCLANSLLVKPPLHISILSMQILGSNPRTHPRYKVCHPVTPQIAGVLFFASHTPTKSQHHLQPKTASPQHQAQVLLICIDMHKYDMLTSKICKKKNKPIPPPWLTLLPWPYVVLGPQSCQLCPSGRWVPKHPLSTGNDWGQRLQPLGANGFMNLCSALYVPFLFERDYIEILAYLPVWHEKSREMRKMPWNHSSDNWQ